MVALDKEQMAAVMVHMVTVVLDDPPDGKIMKALIYNEIHVEIYDLVSCNHNELATMQYPDEEGNLVDLPKHL